MRADGSGQHLVATGLQGVVQVAWGSAPPVPAGSPGTLSQPIAPAPTPGSSHFAGCHKAPTWDPKNGSIRQRSVGTGTVNAAAACPGGRRGGLRKQFVCHELNID